MKYATKPMLGIDGASIPDYLRDVYHWAYISERSAHWLDRNWVVRLLLFGNDKRLMCAFLDRIQPGAKVWLVANVYGDLIYRAADKIGPNGCFVLTDVLHTQVLRANAKLANRQQARVVLSDAASYPATEKFNLICSFFLLHEVPDARKCAILNHLLDTLPPEGELIMVDYHRPRAWNPAGWILRLVNRWLEPYADALWRHELSSYARAPDSFAWTKHTLFGGLYQVVSVRRHLGRH
ncbi:rhodoquinone biosynthesis methyltransferase RquA [Sideroxyarcus sp. TK5]